ncbi:hypothetical protein [Mycetohabitans sp. B46]|uniref:hypothetical protein n=1 Tax=Mycetohabitans sp. B46 TaxID=2772536 RepID=UPI00307E6FA0
MDRLPNRDATSVANWFTENRAIRIGRAIALVLTPKASHVVRHNPYKWPTDGIY